MKERVFQFGLNIFKIFKKNVGAGRASQVSPSLPPGKELTAAAGILVPCGVCHGKRFVAI